MGHRIHEKHAHTHGPGCGHVAVEHEGHVDYLHDGHMHHLEEGRVECHELADSPANPGACTSGHPCLSHGADHVHGPGCGHEAVPHAGHVDYLVEGHLHSPHDGHCDDHGVLPAR